MTPDEQHCVERLEWHEDRLSKLLQLPGSDSYCGHPSVRLGTYSDKRERGVQKHRDQVLGLREGRAASHSLEKCPRPGMLGSA
jgi:hypothetical protein